ncbi:MAG: sulfatase-like hydrolase/transferase, partial [Myxococcota bacterium]|nr:sulfatase-like hydrolase/transferase [Myxococcota bacterium]
MATLVNLIWLMGCFGEPELKSGSSEKNDIILVSIDTLRADHLAVYGYERQTAPFIDSLAKSGTRFAWARSASPWTLPAHTTMLSGQLPAQHKVVDDTVSLSKDVPVLPELLQASGWNTGGFVSTLYVSRVFGFQRGFDQFEDFDIVEEEGSDSIGFGRRYDADGRDIGEWDPTTYRNLGEDPI